MKHSVNKSFILSFSPLLFSLRSFFPPSFLSTRLREFYFEGNNSHVNLLKYRKIILLLFGLKIWSLEVHQY